MSNLSTGYKVSTRQISKRADAVIGLAAELMGDTSVEAGWDFFDSMKDHAKSIKVNANKNGYGDSSQYGALENMWEGLMKWVDAPAY